MTVSIGNLASDAIKLAMARNENKWQLQKKVHGVTSHEYSELREKIWSSGQMHELLPLWEEESKYLDASIDLAIQKNQALIAITAIAQNSSKDSMKAHLIKRLEDNRHALSEAIRDLARFLPACTQEAFSLIGSSEVLSKDVVGVLYALGTKLPNDLKKLTLGGQTVEKHLLDLAANPVELRHKVLKHLGIRPDGHMVIAEKQLGLILGDAYIAGSGLEGYVFSEAFELVRCFHEALSPELCREIEAMHAYSKSLTVKFDYKVFDSIVSALQKDRRVATPSGWVTPTGGHAMIAECVLEPNGQATMRLYNQGAGLHYHNVENSAFRERRGAYIEKRDIPQHLVLTPAFWMILLGLKCRESTSSKEPYGAEDLYSWFIDCIPGTLVDAQKMILPQRSGSCAFKSILAYLKGRMTDEAYDSFILRFKVGTLIRYEEDLFLRKKSINKTEERFMLEIRQKLTCSVETQAKVGRITDETKTLLLSYLSTPLCLLDDTGSTPTICQLRSRFKKLEDAHFDYDISQCTKEHNRTYENRKFLAQSPNVRMLCSDTLPMWISHVLEYEINNPKDYLAQLPTLASLKETFALLSDNDASSLCNKLRQLITNKFVKIQENPITVAWFTEAYIMLAETRLAPSIDDMCLSIEYKAHPLELPSSYLYKRPILSPDEERLLQEWRICRYEQRERPRLYKTATHDKQLVHMLNPKAAHLAEKLPSQLVDLILLRAELESGIQASGIMVHPENRRVLVLKNPKPAAHYFIKTVENSTPPVLPFIGIDAQLTLMEQDIEKIAFFKPETTWIALSFTRDAPLALDDDPKLGFSPLTTLVNPQGITTRLKRLTERLFKEHPGRIDLAETLFTLVGYINQRISPEHAILLNIGKNCPKELDEFLAYYLLTLPKDKIDESQRGFGHALGKIIMGHKQAPSILEKVVDQSVPISDMWWQVACARYKQDNVVIGQDGAPYINDVLQLRGHPQAMQEIFPDLAFGPWHALEQNLTPLPLIGRLWRSPTTNALVIQAHNYSFCSDSKELLLANSATLAIRLEKLGINMPKELQNDMLYECTSTANIDGLPTSLSKDHFEFWYPVVKADSRNGLIVDTKQRIAYLVEGNKHSLRIVNLTTETELLTGKLNSCPNMLFTWHSTKVAIPYLGRILDNGAIPVEVWAKGRGKTFQLWFGCMDGAIRFFVTAKSDGTISYESLDYPGFYWQPKKSISEFGMLNGLVLTKGAEELLIVPEQRLYDDPEHPYRQVWLSCTDTKPIVFRRKLHPDLAPEDINQRLFTTENLKHYSYLIQELMLQRDWGRARRYVELIMPSSGQVEEFVPETRLSHPKALVLLLRVIAKTGYKTYFEKNLYKKYIDQYHHLEPTWALEEHEEAKLASWADPLREDTHIQNHLQRLRGSLVPITGTIQLPAAGRQPRTSGKIDTFASGQLPTTLYQLYRPTITNEKVKQLVGNLSKPRSANEALLEAALLWFYMRKDKTQQKSAIGSIRQSLLISTPAEGKEKVLWEQFVAICQSKPAASPAPFSGFTTEYTPATIACEPKHTLRQQERANVLSTKVLAPSALYQHVDHVLSKAAVKNTPPPKSLLRSFNHLYKTPQLLLKELKRVFAQTQAIHTEQIARLKPLGIGLAELYQWLEHFCIQEQGPTPEELLGLETPVETARKKETALRLVELAQTLGELSVLKNTIKLLEADSHPTDEILSRSLSVASIVTEEMPPALRFKLASFMWKKELALRPNQLQIILHTHNVKGLLAQADCGDGKTFAISPGISAISDTLIVNVVPPGIFDTHSREISLSLETDSARLSYPLSLSRHNVWQMLPKLEMWIDAAKREKTPIVTTVSDLASLVLAYFDLLLSSKDAPQRSYRSQLESVRATFSGTSTLLLDEVDAAAKEQVHWTMGERISIDLKRIQMIFTVYDALIAIDAQHQQSLFCLDGKKRFSLERYHSEAVHLIAKYLIENGKFAHLETMDSEWLQEYLTCEQGSKTLEIPEMQKEFLAMLRAELKVYLPHTLSMRYKVEYGPGNQGTSAIPYKAAQVPDPKSRFTLFDIIANLTLQMMLREGPTEDMVRVMAKRLLEAPNAAGAMHYIYRWIGKNAVISDLRGIVEKKGAWRQAVEKIQESPLARLDIASQLLLPKIQLYTHIMQFSVATLEETFGSLIGLTATPYNHAGMNERLADNFLATDAYETTKQKLKNSPIQTYKLLDDDTIRRIASTEGVFALMDPSAWLVDYPNKRVAELILSGARKTIEYVLFWDVEDAAWHVMGHRGFIEVYDKNKHTTDKTFIHFDQARSRGIDMTLPDSCKAIVLVGHDCTLTDLKQASERLRQFKTGKQSVILWVESDKANLDILEHIERNELKMLVNELPIMAKRQMFERCRARLLKLLAANNEEDLVTRYKELLLQEVDHKSFTKHASLEPTPTIRLELDAYQEALKAAYPFLEPDDLTSLEKAKMRCLSALQEAQNSKYQPSLDMRAQVVVAQEAYNQERSVDVDIKAEAQSQQKVATQVETAEKNGTRGSGERLMAQELLTALQNNGLPQDEDHSIIGKFKASRINALFARLQAPKNIWISAKIAPYSEIELQDHPLKRDLYKRIKACAYILQLPQDTLFLSHNEADSILKELIQRSYPTIKLIGLDGRDVCTSQALVDMSILHIASIYNASLGPLSVRDFAEAVPSAERTSFLKDRLAHVPESDPRHYSNNELVRIFKPIMPM